MQELTEHPLEKVAYVLGGRWRTIVVLFLMDGPKRFSDIQKETKIARSMLRGKPPKPILPAI